MDCPLLPWKFLWLRMAVSPSDWCNDVGAGTGETEESWSFQVMTGLESSAKKKEVSQKLIWEVREATQPQVMWHGPASIRMLRVLIPFPVHIKCLHSKVPITSPTSTMVSRRCLTWTGLGFIYIHYRNVYHKNQLKKPDISYDQWKTS
jgi:hypothetical protein